MKQLITLSLASLALVACQTTAAPPSTPGLTLTPIASNGQDLSAYELDDKSTLESRRPGAIVSLVPTPSLSEYGAAFTIGLENHSDDALTFGLTNIKATSGSRSLTLKTPASLRAEVDGRARAELRARDPLYDPSNPRDIELALDAVSRERSYNNFGGCPAGQGRCMIERDDAGAGYRDDERDRQASIALANEVGGRLQEEYAAIELLVPQDGAVAPGGLAGGVVVVEYPAVGETLTLTAEAAGHQHIFEYRIDP